MSLNFFSEGVIMLSLLFMEFLIFLITYSGHSVLIQWQCILILVFCKNVCYWCEAALRGLVLIFCSLLLRWRNDTIRLPMFRWNCVLLAIFLQLPVTVRFLPPDVIVYLRHREIPLTIINIILWISYNDA